MTSPPTPNSSPSISMELLAIFGLLGIATLLAMAMAIGFWWILSRKSHAKTPPPGDAPPPHSHDEIKQPTGVTPLYTRDEQSSTPSASSETTRD